MSKVSIKVGPKTYGVVTADGDEDRVAALASAVDAKYQMLGHPRAVQETDNLVLASLLLADELEDARKALAETEQAREHLARLRSENAALEAEVAQLRKAALHQHDLFAAEGDNDPLAEQLEALAARAEAAATALEALALEGGAEAD